MNLLQRLDGVKMIKVDLVHKVALAWYGGHSIHVYDADGHELDLFNVGSFEQNEASPEEVRQGMADIMKEWQELDERESF